MQFLKSKAAAWCALLISVLVICLTFRMRSVWWAYTDEFFLFMAVFCRLVSAYISRLSATASRKLNTCAMVAIILMAASLVGEYAAWQFICR